MTQYPRANPLPDSFSSAFMAPQFYSTGHPQPASSLLAAAPARTERSDPAQRKRPKYTRSKLGCLTCRAKKIKCDEVKPICKHCKHGERVCTWPEEVTKKKVEKRRASEDDRHLNAGTSSGHTSEHGSPPSSREPSPKDRLHEGPGTVSYDRKPSLPHLGSTLPYSLRPADLSQAFGLYSQSLPQTYSLPSFPSSSDSLLPSFNSALLAPLDNTFGPSRAPAHSLFDNNAPPPLIDPARFPDLVHHSDNNHLLDAHHLAYSPSPLPSLDPIEPYFRTAQERNLIRHYCANLESFQMACPSEVNPILDVNLPLILGQPPDRDPATDALRLAVLGVGAVHQSHLLARAGVRGGEDLLSLTLSLRLAATQKLAAACHTIEGTWSDAALGASLAIALIDIFAGGKCWGSNLTFAKTLVSLRGGPAVMINENIPAEVKFGGGVRMSAARLWLEILAVYETFGSLTSGEEPTLLAPDVSTWWFEDTYSSYHVHSVEKVFGMSRSMVALVARVSTFLSRFERQKAILTEVVHDGQLVDSVDPAAGLLEDAKALFTDVELWADTELPQNVQTRVRNGNAAHKLVLQIILLRDVFRVDREDPRVQRFAKSIVALCLESAKSGMGVDLTWPVIIAGSQLAGSWRETVLTAFEAFRKQCEFIPYPDLWNDASTHEDGVLGVVGCFEIDTADQIVREVWSRVDAHAPRADWRSVIHDLDLRVLIL